MNTPEPKERDPATPRPRSGALLCLLATFCFLGFAIVSAPSGARAQETATEPNEPPTRTATSELPLPLQDADRFRAALGSPFVNAALRQEGENAKPLRLRLGREGLGLIEGELPDDETLSRILDAALSRGGLSSTFERIFGDWEPSSDGWIIGDDDEPSLRYSDDTLSVELAWGTSRLKAIEWRNDDGTHRCALEGSLEQASGWLPETVRCTTNGEPRATLRILDVSRDAFGLAPLPSFEEAPNRFPPPLPRMPL